MFLMDGPYFIVPICSLILSIFLILPNFTIFASGPNRWFSFITFPFIVFLSGHLTGNVYTQILIYVWISLGIIAAIKSIDKLKNFKLQRKPFTSKYNSIITSILILYLGAWFIKALVPHAVTDPTIYHLQAPKTWVLFFDGPKFNPLDPISYITSYYEYWYYSIFLVLKPLLISLSQTNNTYFEVTLTIAMISSQMISSIIAFIFIPILISRYLKFYPIIYKSTAIILIMGLNTFVWIWPAAKNDAFPFMALLVFINYYKKFPALSFFTLGIAIATKITNLIVLIPTLLLIFWFDRKKITVIFTPIKIFGIFMIVAISFVPWLLRNYLETQNPFYPNVLLGFQNSYFSETALNYLNTFVGPSSFPSIMHKLSELFQYHLGLTAIVVIGILNKQWLLSFGIILVSVAASYFGGPDLSWRTFSVMLILPLMLFKQMLLRKYRLITSLFFSLFIFGIGHFQPENYLKIAKFLAQSSTDVVQSRYPYLQETIATNLENCQNSPPPILKNNGGGKNYFSRFQFTNIQDSKIFQMDNPP